MGDYNKRYLIYLTKVDTLKLEKLDTFMLAFIVKTMSL